MLNKVTLAQQAYQHLEIVSPEERAKSFLDITKRIEHSFNERSVLEVGLFK